MSGASVTTPAVSVVVPVYNGGAWLARAIDSILRQTFTDFELIAIDDGSSDGSFEQLQAVARTDVRIRVLQQPHGGAVPALNRGLAAARAPLMARLDADDLAHETRLERQVDFMARRPEVGVVGAWGLEIDGRGRLRGRRTPPTGSDELKRLLARNNPFVHSAIMARTDLLRRLGGYRAAFATEDYDLWLRTAEVTELANLPEFLVSYRVHAGGVSRRDPLGQAFSARLARRSAMARRELGLDPADALQGPPDWRGEAAAGSFYAEDAALYRWLDTSQGASLAPGVARGLLDGTFELDHTERRLAARALWTRMRSADRLDAANARDLLLRLVRRHPGAVLKAAWSLRG